MSRVAVEYTVIDIEATSDAHLVEQLNKIGKDGWRVVFVQVQGRRWGNFLVWLMREQ